MKPDNKAKATLNLLETIPSTSGNESKEIAPMEVVTRVQRALNKETKSQEEERKCEKSSPNSWKAHRQRRITVKKHRVELALEKPQKEARSS